MGSRRRFVIVAGSVALSLVVVSVGAAYAWSKVEHRGMYFVAAKPGAVVVVTAHHEGLKGEHSGAAKSDSCIYLNGSVYVPVRIRSAPVDSGGWTVHVTVTVVNRPDGADGGDRDGGDGSTIATATQDITINGATDAWSSVRMERSEWATGADDCSFTWTVTPGAWFFNDD